METLPWSFTDTDNGLRRLLHNVGFGMRTAAGEYGGRWSFKARRLWGEWR
ncbi:distinct helicase family with a unique C-terminal domain including [Sesbania bispinosa]|nr:distinct helicase family with a unique C-terminal domain including [Sesbania bispinosa]